MRLRTYLIALVGATMLPLLAFAAWTTWRVMLAERDLAARELVRLAASGAGALEAEFGRAIALGLTLAEAPSLRAGDRTAFAEHAYRAAEANATSLGLGDQEGRQTFNSRLPLDSTAPAAPVPDLERRLRALGRPFVTEVRPSPIGDALVAFAIVPVRGAPPDLAVGLGVRVDLPQLARLLPTPVSGARGFSLALDGQGFVAARTIDAPATFPAPAVAELPDGATRNLAGPDGQRLVVARNRIAGTDWQIVVALPEASIAAIAWTTLRSLGIGGMVSLVLAMLCAVLLARFLLRQAHGLVDIATSSADGASPTVRVAELRVLRDALDAGRAALRHDAETRTRLAMASENAAELERRIAEQTRELEIAMGRLLTAEDGERRRIARDLHDSTVQELVAASLGVAQALADLPQARVPLQEVAACLDRAKQELRTVAFVLQPPLLDDFGLPMAMRVYAEGLSKRSGIAIAVEADPSLPRLNSTQETALFRVLQEALANAVTYSGAEHVSIRLLRSDGSVILEVADDGRGMGLAGERPSEGVGIPAMRARLRHIGGTLAIFSAGDGTTIRATVAKA